MTVDLEFIVLSPTTYLWRKTLFRLASHPDPSKTVTWFRLRINKTTEDKH